MCVISKSILWSVVLLACCASTLCAQQSSNTYKETRKWLVKADAQSGNNTLKKLFMEGDQRIDDLIQALGDEDATVSINAQRIIRYLADPKGAAVLADPKNWCKKTCSSPIMNVLAEPKALRGTSSDPIKIAKDNRGVFDGAHFNAGDVSFRLIGHNKRANVALIEVIQGQVFTAGWHSVIQWKDGKWRLISDSNLWVH